MQSAYKVFCYRFPVEVKLDMHQFAEIVSNWLKHLFGEQKITDRNRVLAQITALSWGMLYITYKVWWFDTI